MLATMTPDALTDSELETIADEHSAEGAPPLAGSPRAIEEAAQWLLEQVHAGSVDGESFAGNVKIALDALGIQLPAAFAPMIEAALRSGYVPAVPA